MEADKIPVIVVAGPTASGKTALAVKIAVRYNGEIVSADSMQIYKYMDIGTAKPDEAEKRGIVHHMMDFADPLKGYSVAEYTAAAHKVIAGITARGKLPIVAGGTGLYITSLINDVDFTENEGDPKLRRELWEYAEKHGAHALHDMLEEIDPVQAEAVHENNVKRVIRAIEFYRTTGIKMSEHQAESKHIRSRYDALMMMIDFEREELYERIDRRVDMMIEAGLVDEVRRLVGMGLTAEHMSMSGIGYKEVIGYLNGERSLEETVALIKQSSRRYAKRQLTWFRRDKRIKPIPADENMEKTVFSLIDEWMRSGGYVWKKET